MAMNLERVGEILYYVAFFVLFVYHGVVRDWYVQHIRQEERLKHPDLSTIPKRAHKTKPPESGLK